MNENNYIMILLKYFKLYTFTNWHRVNTDFEYINNYIN